MTAIESTSGSSRADVVLTAGLGAAWLSTVLLLTGATAHRSVPLTVGLTLLFTGYFAYRVLRWARRRPRSREEALGLLCFLGSAMPVLKSWFGFGLGATVLLRDAAWGLGVVLVVHVFLEVARRVGEGLPRAGWGPALVGWIAGMWLFSTAVQIARFRWFATGGNPEDTALFFDLFRTWRSTGVPTSEWVTVWGHVSLDHYFALHFSPVIYPFFWMVSLAPRIETLLLVQNLMLLLGCVLWARVLREQIVGSGGSPLPEADLWVVAFFVSHPIVGGALREELHPLLWALPALALLHLAYLRRSLLWFGVAGLSVFAFREDLGLVVASYAVVALLTGRFRPRDWAWLVLPLAAGVLTLVIRQDVMPEFGVRDPGVFQRLFDTDRSGIVAFVASVAQDPPEAVTRLFRPAHLQLLAILLLTGVGWPGRSPLVLVGLPYAALLALVGPDSLLLQLETHYAFVPGLYILCAGVLFAMRAVGRRPPGERRAVFAVMLALTAAVPVRLIVPEGSALLAPGTYRAEVLEDLRAIPQVGLTAVPNNLLIGAPPSRTTVLHTRDFFLNPEEPDVLPAYGLVRNGFGIELPADEVPLRTVSLSEPIVRGHRYSLHALEYGSVPRDP